MSPEERALLEHTLKLSEENNKILKRIARAARWAFVWGLIKVVIIVTPIVIGFILLQPFFEQLAANYNGLKELLNF